eukprot:2072624-Pyramimonas_sp.AAC.1
MIAALALLLGAFGRLPQTKLLIVLAQLLMHRRLVTSLLGHVLDQSWGDQGPATARAPAREVVGPGVVGAARRVE